MPRGIRVTRQVHDVPSPPYYRAVRGIAGNLDRWFIYDFLLPGTLLMHSGGRPVADSDGDNRAVRLHSCQTVTPETDHYDALLLPAVAPRRARATTRSPKRSTALLVARSTKTGR